MNQVADFSEEHAIPKHFIIFTQDNRALSSSLPDHGTVTITMHDGQVRYVETTTKEKVE